MISDEQGQQEFYIRRVLTVDEKNIFLMEARRWYEGYA